MKTLDNKTEEIIRTLIVDDHHLVRDGLKAMLISFRKEIHLEITEADSGEKALHYLNDADVDLILMDFKMEGLTGAETVERILRFKPAVKILALSNYNEYPIITAMMDAGALGYVLKSIHPSQLLTAIKTVLAGKKYFCNEAALTMIAAADDKDASKRLAYYKVTGRELEVLLLIVQGMTNIEIAEKLYLTKRTIDTHRQNLLKKMKVKNTAALVRLAVELNLLK
jgi:DNA-binding NarL/FixJ family response regulator